MLSPWSYPFMESLLEVFLEGYGGKFGSWRGGLWARGFDFLALPLAAKGEILRTKSVLNWPSFATRVIEQY